MAWRLKLARITAMSWAERGLLLEAAWFLGLSRLALMIMPFRQLARWLERRPRASTKATSANYCQIRRAVSIAARNVPWNAVCLPQAMTAKLMLARRGCASTLHLGVAKDGRGTLLAHAWLEASGVTVVGGAAKADFSSISHFG
ncbi:MAG TPA: lasso peptide biosynthesis B2 protein [Candidatus Binataceae bacterium]|nr:lasso peptide biosynthesis B2 protein [Candidatus Binataceae bacterium]